MREEPEETGAASKVTGEGDITVEKAVESLCFLGMASCQDFVSAGVPGGALFVGGEHAVTCVEQTFGPTIELAVDCRCIRDGSIPFREMTASQRLQPQQILHGRIRCIPANINTWLEEAIRGDKGLGCGVWFGNPLVDLGHVRSIHWGCSAASLLLGRLSFGSFLSVRVYGPVPLDGFAALFNLWVSVPGPSA